MGGLTIAVVMAAYNGEKYIRASLESILRQRTAPAEVIVIDDGSADATPQIVRSFGSRVRLVTQGNTGEAAARNHGIAVASADLVTTVDQDDLWHPDHLTRLLQAFVAAGAGEQTGVVPTSFHFVVADDTDRTYPDATVVPAGHDLQTWLDEHVPAPGSATHPLDSRLYAERSNGNTMFARRTFFLTCGGFPIGIPGVGDYALLANAAAIGQLVGMESPTVYYRSHPLMSSYSYDMVVRSLATRVHLSTGGRITPVRSVWDAYLVGGMLAPGRPLLASARTALGYWALLRPPSALTARVAARSLSDRVTRAPRA